MNNSIKEKKIEVKSKKNNIFLTFGSFFKYFINFIKRFWKILILILLIVVAIVIYKYVSDYLYNKKYKPFEVKMHTYGFDKMYNDSKATSKEKVTKSEAIKLILSSIYNTYDISGFAYETTDKYSNAIWVTYAKKQGIIPDDYITSENENSYITYSDVIQYYIKARIILLKKSLTSDSQSGFSDLSSYNTDLQTYINDAVSSGLIDNSKGKLKANNDITKGQFNEFIIRFVEKYNTIVLNGDKLNVDPSKTPSNADEYPYILFNVDKAVYEKPFSKELADNFLNPIDTYIKKKNYYSQIKEMAEDYYNKILNINYQTINIDDFKNSILKNTSAGASDDEINQYINYVKQHKIKISGTAKAQMPIVYYDGIDYRIRMILNFSVESSDTKENVIFEDLKPVNYSLTKTNYSDKNNLIIDAKLGLVLFSNTLYVDIGPMSQIVVK